MQFSVLYKFLTNVKCLFSWKSSLKSVKDLAIPPLLQLQLFINKTGTALTGVTQLVKPSPTK